MLYTLVGTVILKGREGSIYLNGPRKEQKSCDNRRMEKLFGIHEMQ